MEYEEFETKLDELKESLGDEGAKHADEFIAFKSAFKDKVDTISDKVSEIEKLTQDNSDLLKTNGKLFQQVGREIKGEDDITSVSTEPPAEEKIKIEDIFDNHGRMKR